MAGTEKAAAANARAAAARRATADSLSEDELAALLKTKRDATAATRENIMTYAAEV